MRFGDTKMFEDQNRSWHRWLDYNLPFGISSFQVLCFFLEGISLRINNSPLTWHQPQGRGGEEYPGFWSWSQSQIFARKTRWEQTRANKWYSLLKKGRGLLPLKGIITTRWWFDTLLPRKLTYLLNKSGWKMNIPFEPVLSQVFRG